MKFIYNFFFTIIILFLIYFSVSYFFIEKFLNISVNTIKNSYLPGEKIHLQAAITNYSIHKYNVIHSDPLFSFKAYKNNELIYTHPEYVMSVGKTAHIHPFKKYKDQNTSIKNKIIILNNQGVYDILCIARFKIKEREYTIKSKPIKIEIITITE